MFNLFLAALGMDYLQHGDKPCQHERLYRDGTTVRCRDCRDYWPFQGRPENFPANWEELIRRKIARERGG